MAVAAGGARHTLVLDKPWPTVPAWMQQRTYLTGEFLMQVRVLRRGAGAGSDVGL